MAGRILTGGPAGVDLAGRYAARAYGILTGGAMPPGFLTEDGPRPDAAEPFGAVGRPTGGDRRRARADVRDPGGTPRFGDDHPPGGPATLDACRVMGKPSPIAFRAASRPGRVRDRIAAGGIRARDVAGDRESSPGTGDRMEAFLGRVLRRLGHRRAGRVPPMSCPRNEAAPVTSRRGRMHRGREPTGCVRPRPAAASTRPPPAPPRPAPASAWTAPGSGGARRASRS